MFLSLSYLPLSQFKLVLLSAVNLTPAQNSVAADRRSNHEEIFIDRSEQLKALDCHIIYTIPFAILFSKWANDLNQNYNRLVGE